MTIAVFCVLAPLAAASGVMVFRFNSMARATIALLAAGIFTTRWPHRAGTAPRDPTFRLGEALMGPQMLTMVTLGVTLLATMVGAVVLATSRGRYDRFGDDLKRRPPADPARGGPGR